MQLLYFIFISDFVSVDWSCWNLTGRMLLFKQTFVPYLACKFHKEWGSSLLFNSSYRENGTFNHQKRQAFLGNMPKNAKTTANNSTTLVMHFISSHVNLWSKWASHDCKEKATALRHWIISPKTRKILLEKQALY